jgi:PQQ-like domain
MTPARMKRFAWVAVAAVGSIALLHGQGRGGGEWTTSGYDAQRTAWQRGDARLTKTAVQKGEFQFLWKARFDNDPRQLNSLTTPIILDRLIGYRGFKALAFIGGSDDRVFAIDTDLARPYWTTMLNYSAATGGRPPSSWECPGGLIATPSRRTVLTTSALGGGSGGGRGGARNGSAVGEPGKGAAVLSQQQPRSGDGPPPAPAPQGRARGPAPIGFGGVDPVYVMGSDGYLHTLLSSNGADAEPPVPFLPPNSRPSALLWVDGVVYATTSNNCGATPNGVWAIDLTAAAADRKTLSWKTGGANVAGDSGPALGTDGTLFVAIAKPPPASRRSTAATDGQGPEQQNYADAIVALDRDTLRPKDWFSAPGADFNASPIVVRHKDKDLVAATANDGRLYLLDGSSLGGSDHKTPLHVTPKYTSTGTGTALATWEDQGTRWILATAAGAPAAGVKFASNGVAPNGRVVAFKVIDQDGKLSLEPAWASRDLASPLAPIVVNGMVMAVSSGEYRPASASAATSASERARRSTPAVLYVLDGPTGKTLWSSGTKITSFARAGLSAGDGQVYLVTFDNHLYAFGIPMEH